ncbi:MAG: polyprenyl synthetase family protein [Gammaproteobacteria bacterium]
MAQASASLTPTRAATDLGALRALIDEDFRATDRLIRHELRSDVALINQLGEYIINGGGKRLRPMLVLLAARACGVSDGRHVNLAAIIEFIHTATLLHDDVVDASGLRRGRETANAIWGNEASVLVGDFLYSRAFQMMVAVNDMRVMQILADATNLIAEGEVMQLLNCHDPDTTEARYLQVIRRKTATLFQAGARLGAVITARSDAEQAALAAYGLHLGSAFQLIDDALDYNASSVEMGKNTGDDLAEGKPTLPLIYAMQTGNPAQRKLVRAAIRSGGRGHIDGILPILRSTGALEYTFNCAQQERERALASLAALPDSAYKHALRELADFSVERRS